MSSKKNSNFSKRLREIMVDKNLTQSQLSKATGISASSISDWINNKYDAKQDKIDLIATKLDISPAYLMGYDVEKDRVNVNVDDIPGIINIQKAIRIPILGEIACGEPIFATQNYEGYFLGDPDIVQADFALRAEGDSMINANIHSGDLVLFRKTNQAENGKIVAVIIDDTATLKRLRKTKDSLILMPENENYDPIIISKNDHRNILIIGEMVAVLQKRSE